MRLPVFVLFGTLKYINGQNRAFFVLISPNIGCSFCIRFWAVSMVFLTDLSGSYVTRYNRAQILLPEPQKISRSSRKNFSVFQKKFLGVPAKISRCSMKSFGLCHEIIWPVILKSFGLSQDLPLSQNGQNFRQKKRGMGRMGPLSPLGQMGNMLILLIGLFQSICAESRCDIAKSCYLTTTFLWLMM